MKAKQLIFGRALLQGFLPGFFLIIGCLIAGFLNVAAARADDRPEWLPDGSIGSGIPTLADPTGLRAALWKGGIKFALNYFGEVQSSISGGMKTGTYLGGRLELVIDADLEKALGWTGAAIHANAFQIHGTGLSRYDIGNIMPVSFIEALPTTRLYEAWFEQKFVDNKVALRAGQLGADMEFMVSNYVTIFMNASFGWPAIAASNLPSGGPAYPLSTPGARLGFYPTDSLSVLLAVLDGNPAGNRTADPQRRDAYGINFRLGDPALVMGELQYKYGDDKAPKGLSGTVKFGGWYHFGKFGDYRYDINGVRLANPASTGMPMQYSGNSGIYAMIDQQLIRAPDDPTKGVGVFVRVMSAPSDRNLVDFYADGGVNFNGLIASRGDDNFGFAVAYARIGSNASGFDSDVNLFAGTRGPVRSSEFVFEASYSAQLAPGWLLQPDLQYIVRPGGGIPNPYDPTGLSAVRNATVIGLKTTLKY